MHPSVHIEYTSTRIECADGHHYFDEWDRIDWTAERLEKMDWVKDKTPYSSWVRRCNNCDYRIYEDVKFKADLPEHLKEQ